MRPKKHKTKKVQYRKDKKTWKRNKRKKTKRNKKTKVRPNRRNNINNENNYQEAAPRPVHVCDNFKYPKSVKSKTTRIFAIIGHSSFCSYDDLIKIKKNREPDGFRLDLQKYKDFPNLRYIPVQDIGKKSSTMRMEHFIRQLKNNEKIHSGLIQLDDIKSTKNFSRLVDCEFFKENPDDYNYIKRHLTRGNTTLNFNVYPKKDRYGTQNPINTQYEFISHEPDTPFTGIYELTEYKDDSNNSNNVNSVQQDINSQWPSNNTNDIENTIANNNNNNNSNFSLGIHYDDILFNPKIKQEFFKQREREINLLSNQSKIIKTKENMRKSTQDPTHISAWDLRNTKLAALRGSLMIPNSYTEGNLMSRGIYSEDDMDVFTEYNKLLYKLIEQRYSTGSFEVSLDDIIGIILNHNYMRSDDDFIILDFGCKHIIDIPYEKSVWDRPTNSMSRESTIKLGYPLSAAREVGSVLETGKYPYITNKLFTEAGN